MGATENELPQVFRGLNFAGSLHFAEMAYPRHGFSVAAHRVSAAMVLVLLSLTACATRKQVIPMGAMANLQVSEKAELGSKEVTISGWYFDSSAAIGPVKTTTNMLEGVILIEAHARTFPSRILHRTETGTLNLTLAIPPGIDRVDFGELGSTIWRNERGALQ